MSQGQDAGERRRPAPQSARLTEVRLALVCYGGVSLAVYMHGMTKELFKLVRASRVFEAVWEADPALDPVPQWATSRAQVEGALWGCRAGA